MRARTTLDLVGRWCGVTLMVLLAGCSVQVSAGDGDSDGGGGAPEVITVWMVNNTTKPVDPQVFVGWASGGIGGLFAAANQRRDFGFAGAGLLEPGAEASFDVACDPRVLIGTQGGIFGDNLATPLGQGQQRVVEQDVGVMCNEAVVFSYTAVGDELRTGVAVRP